MRPLACCLRNHPGKPSDIVQQRVTRTTAAGLVEYMRPFCRICKNLHAQEMKRTGGVFARQPVTQEPYGVTRLSWPAPGRSDG